MKYEKCPKCSDLLLSLIKIHDSKRVIWQECSCGFSTDPTLPRTFDDWEGRVKSPACKIIQQLDSTSSEKF